MKNGDHAIGLFEKNILAFPLSVDKTKSEPNSGRNCLAPCPKRVCSGRGEVALTAEPPKTSRERRENDVPDGVYTQAGFNAAR